MRTRSLTPSEEHIRVMMIEARRALRMDRTEFAQAINQTYPSLSAREDGRSGWSEAQLSYAMPKISRAIAALADDLAWLNATFSDDNVGLFRGEHQRRKAKS